MRRHSWLCVAIAVGFASVGTGGFAQQFDSKQLSVTVGRAGVEDTGFVKIAGEIRNNSKEWACTPAVDVGLLDASGKALSVQSIVTAVKAEKGKPAVDGVVADRTYLPPGEVAAFQYIRDVTKIEGKYASHRVTARANACPNRPTVKVESFAALKGTDGWYSVAGRVKNVGTVACRSAKAVIACYTTDGKVYRVDSAQPDESFQKILAPGQSVAFAIKAIENPGGNTIADVKAWADCALPE